MKRQGPLNNERKGEFLCEFIEKLDNGREKKARYSMKEVSNWSGEGLEGRSALYIALVTRKFFVWVLLISRIFLLASKVKLFKLLVIFLRKLFSWQRGLQKKKKNFVWLYPHPRDFLPAAIMPFLRPKTVMEKPCMPRKFSPLCDSSTQVRMRYSLVLCATSCIC